MTTPMLLLAAITAMPAPCAVAGEPADSLAPVVQLREVEVVSTPKEQGELRLQPTASTSVGNLRQQHITSLKEASTRVPNLFIPDYGSRLTSAVYVRGVGTRSGTPAVGLYVDNVPYSDKSAFDFNYFDIERVDVLRGPQATLYGRNAMGGIIKVHTKNPFRYQGTDVHLGYATGNNRATASLAHYHRLSDRAAFSAAAYAEAAQGFFTNTITGKDADHLAAAGGRMRGILQPNARLRVDLSVSYDHDHERAYPYYYEGAAAGSDEDYAALRGTISNNRPNTYRRSLLNAGANVEWQGRGWMLTSITGYQRLHDRMALDQDFLSADIYTLMQKQHMHSVNEELIMRSTRPRRYQWLNGLNLMYQHMRTHGPVTFHSDGLHWLESTINQNMPSTSSIATLQALGYSTMAVNLRGEQLRMDGTYTTPTTNAALFHQSTLSLPRRWQLSLGARLDMERHRMKYRAPATVPYGFNMTNDRAPAMAVDLQDLTADILYEGDVHATHWNLLPRLSLQRHFGDNSNVYASVSCGQHSGGYNLQMFSDLLQEAMSVAMMSGVRQGVADYVDLLAQRIPAMPSTMVSSTGQTVSLGEYVSEMMAQGMPAQSMPAVSQIKYDPETSWNFELGSHFRPGARLTLDVALFYSLIHDQQIARFTANGLGRMLVNAGKSRSWGAEVQATWTPLTPLSLQAAYGFTRATFKEYEDGQNDYSGNYVPFVPRHTLSAEAMYTWTPRRAGEGGVRSVGFAVNTQGHGRLFWTEDNALSQTFRAQMGARVVVQTALGDVSLWGRNLTNHRFDTFRFVSANRVFHQRNTPRQFGVDLTLRI